MAWIYIAIGGALGALSRAGVNEILSAIGTEREFPLGTLIANLVGCFLIGIVAESLRPLTGETKTLLVAGVMTGFLGSMTTFSTFAWQSWELFSKEMILGVLNIIVHVVGGLLLVFIGQILASRFVHNIG